MSPQSVKLKNTVNFNLSDKKNNQTMKNIYEQELKKSESKHATSIQKVANKNIESNNPNI